MPHLEIDAITIDSGFVRVEPWREWCIFFFLHLEYARLFCAFEKLMGLG